MIMPSITRIGTDACGGTRYRLEGGDMAGGWARPGHLSWCEISVSRDSDYLGAYGGEVWPAAWPSLFETGRGTAQTGPWTRVTAVGKALLAAAPDERRRCRHCAALLGTAHDPICASLDGYPPGRVSHEWCDDADVSA